VLATWGAVTCSDRLHGYCVSLSGRHGLLADARVWPCSTPVDPVTEALDRWRAGERAEVLRCDFLGCDGRASRRCYQCCRD
jgi:hypothetical protein